MELVDSNAEELLFEGASIFMGVGGDGTASIEAGDCRVDVGLGETILVPACLGGGVKVSSSGDCRLLAVGIRG